MDKEKALLEIQTSIKNGNLDAASVQISELANCFSDEPYTLLTCASLSKTVGNEKNAKDIVKMISATINNDDVAIETAKGLRGIGFPKEADAILSKIENNDDAVRQRLRALLESRSYERSVDLFNTLSDPTLSDRTVYAMALSGAGKNEDAVLTARILSEEFPNDIEAKRCYCSVLVASGKDKDAEKFVKGQLKKNKNSADTDALAAYFMWLEGRTSSAGAYAAKAVKEDPGNILGMEILAYCLADKKKYDHAKTIAGAINEKDPGNPAAMRILDMCRV